MTRPLLYAQDLLPAIDPDLLAEGSVDDKIQAGLDRLLSMQTPSGGFGVWPGDDEPVLFGTAYVVHLLLDAKEKGFRVPDEALRDAVAWLDAHAEDQDGGPKFVGTHPGYVEYVLARAGKPHAAVVAKMLAEATPSTRGQDVEGRYLLMAALQASGDRRHEKELRKLDVSPVGWVRANDWSYYSDLRRRAMTLAVYHELFGADATGAPLADVVAAGLKAKKDSYAYTTQELMWGVSALGKWVGRGAKIPAAKLLVDGKVVPLSKDRASGGESAWQVSGGSRMPSLVLELAEKPAVPLAMVVTTEGVKPDAALPTGSHGLSASRKWWSPTGEPVTLSSLELGQLLYVELTLENPTSERIENVALVDRIPAGWEIENPRLGRGQLPDWASEHEPWAADYLDLKDDRYMIFGGLEPRQTAKVLYAVRVVSAGTFTMPGMWAEAMYDPEIWARQGPVEGVVVEGPWSDEVLR